MPLLPDFCHIHDFSWKHALFRPGNAVTRRPGCDIMRHLPLRSSCTHHKKGFFLDPRVGVDAAVLGVDPGTMRETSSWHVFLTFLPVSVSIVNLANSNFHSGVSICANLGGRTSSSSTSDVMSRLPHISQTRTSDTAGVHTEPSAATESFASSSSSALTHQTKFTKLGSTRNVHLSCFKLQ